MKRKRIGAAVRYGFGLLLLLILELATGDQWILTGIILFLLLPLVSWLANGWVCRKIRGEMTISPTAAKGSACSGMVCLENRSWLPTLNLQCRIGMINDLTGEQKILDMETALGPKQSVKQEFLLESNHCGRIYLFMESVKLFDFFALFPRRVPMKTDARVTILPELFPCEVSMDAVAPVSDDSTASRRGEDPTEVFQLREYQSGDDIRRIHWKLSSKLDTLILRESSQNVSRSLLVFWDKRDPCEPDVMDALAEAVSSLCQSLCDRGIVFDLAWTEKEELERRQIRDGEMLLQTVPALVTQAGIGECPDPDLEEYGQVLYFASNLPGQLYESSCLYLLCTREEQETENTLTFSPENYRERLERLEV